MKKVKFSNKNHVLDFYKDKPPIEISYYKLNINNKNNKNILKYDKNKSHFIESNRLKQIINITSFSSMLILTGILFIHIIHRKK